MVKVTRRWFAIIVGGALLALSANAMAGDKSAAARLGDAELDQITAGSGASSGVIIYNRGEGPGRWIQNRNHVACINCAEPPMEVPRTSGVGSVVTGNGSTVPLIIRQNPFTNAL